MYANTHTHIYTHTQTHIHTYMRIQIHTCMTCMYIDMDMYICTYTYYMKYASHTVHIHVLNTHKLASRTHAHLIGVSQIGASLQHRAHTGHDSEACTLKQEHVLVVVRDDSELGKCCLHLVVVANLKRCFAVLGEDGRQHVRWVCFSSRRTSACMCVHADMCVWI